MYHNIQVAAAFLYRLRKPWMAVVIETRIQLEVASQRMRISENFKLKAPITKDLSLANMTCMSVTTRPDPALRLQ
jgi:hypothetical protein